MKISKGRIAVIIGTKGEVKAEIEKALGVKIDLNSNTGDCEIFQEPNNPDTNAFNVLIAQKIINAINRGFNPVKAMKLLKETYELEVFNLLSVLGKSEKRIKRIKGLIIGRNGEMRAAIEKNADCHVSVYGKTVSIIADYDNLQIARKAVSMLINGIPHQNVLKFLEDKFNEKKKEQFKEFYKPEF